MFHINPKTTTIIKHISEGHPGIVDSIPQNSPLLGHFLAAAIRSSSPLSPKIAVAIIDKGLNQKQVTQVFIRAITSSKDDSRDRTVATINEIERLLSLQQTEEL